MAKIYAENRFSTFGVIIKREKTCLIFAITSKIEKVMMGVNDNCSVNMEMVPNLKEEMNRKYVSTENSYVTKQEA